MTEIRWELGDTDPNAQARAYSYADKIRQNAAQYQAGAKYAAGDIKGAAQTQALAGNIPEAVATEKVGTDRAEAAYAYIGRALPVFEVVAQQHASDPDGGAGAIGAAFDQLAPEIAQVTGHNPEGLAQIRQGLVSNPQGTIQRIKKALPVKYQTVGKTLVRQQGDAVDPVYTAPEAPKPPTVHTFTEGDKTVEKQYNPETGGWDVLSSGPRYKPQAAGGGGNGIGVGKTIDERMQSVLLNGDPSTPQYAAAYGYLSKPRATINPDTGQVVTIKQDLSWAKPPMRDGQQTGGPQPSVDVGREVISPKLTAEMRLAAGFADRQAQAEAEIKGAEDALANPTEKALSSIPGVGNFLVSEKYQKADQARRNWINAQLRRESGAAIADSEFASANRQYFAVPGDSKAVIQQKARNRAAAEQAMRKSASPRSGSQGGGNGGAKPDPLGIRR